MTEQSGSSGSSAYPGQGYGGPPPPSYGQPPPPYNPSQPSYGQGGAYPGAPAGYGAAPPQYSGPPAYPGGGYGMPPPPPGYQAAQTGWSGWAIAAFVTSLIPLVGIIAAVPLAIVALVKIAKSALKGKWLAIAAIVISVLWWIGAIGLAVWWAGQTVDRNNAGQITKEGRLDFGQIQVGDCVNIPDPGGPGNVNTFDLKGVPCGSPHNAETAAILPVSGSSYPGFGVLDSQTVGQCDTRAQSYVAGTGAPATGLQSYRLIPTQSIWDSDNGHRVICFVTRTDYADMTGPLSGQ